jgi:sugar lactone lactonase YvrE
MIFDANGNLYFADLEQNAIMKMDTGAITKFVTGEKKYVGQIALVSIITYCIILTLESMKLAVQ